jgi:hypothetical protein
MIKSCTNKTQLNNLQNQLPKFFYPVEIESEISNLARKFLNEYYLSHDLRINDALIAATAIIIMLNLLRVILNIFNLFHPYCLQNIM